MDPKIKAFKFIKYALDAIKELRQLSPDGANVFHTYSRKLAHPGIAGSDFKGVIRKIESEGIASFNEGLGNTAMGWGNNPLTIEVRDWDKFDEYSGEVKRTYAILSQTLSEGSEGKQRQKHNPVAIRIEGKVKNFKIKNNITSGMGLLEANADMENGSITGNKTIMGGSSINRLEIIGRDKIEQHGIENKVLIKNEKPEKESFKSKFFWWILYIIGGLIIIYLAFKFGWQ